MATIYNTVLATSQPLTISYGFPLFASGSGPFVPSYRKVGLFKSYTLVNFDNKIPIIDLVIVGVDFHVAIKIDFAIGIGMAGPSFALSSAVQGQTFDDGTAVCEFTSGAAEGGLGFGAAMGFTFHFGVGLEVWYDVLVDSGSFQIFGISFSLTINIDLLGAVIEAIEKLMEKTNKDREKKHPKRGVKNEPHFQALAPIDPAPAGFFNDDNNQPTGLDGEVWGIFDKTADPGAIDGGVLNLDPTILIQIDVAQYIPYVKQVKELIETIGGELATGPEFGLGFPVTINVYKLIADGDEYTNPHILSVNSDSYQQALAAAAIDAYNANGWFIPQLPNLLAIAGRTVQLGIYPDTTSYLSSLITGAAGTIPPAPGDGQVGNTVGFTGGPTPARQVINNVTVQFQHQVGLNVIIGWFIHIDVIGITLDASIDVTIPVGGWFPGGISGTKIDQLTNTNGGQFIVMDDSSRLALEEARESIDRRFVDVVFDTVTS